MNIFERITGALRNSFGDGWGSWEADKERRISLDLREGGGSSWAAAFGFSNASGKRMTATSAMQLATVFACVRLTAQAISSLPLKLYERRGDGDRVQADDHAIAVLIDQAPNADQTSVEFWESMVARMALNGDAVAHKRMSGRFLSALEPIAATPIRVNGDLRYEFVDRGQRDTLGPDEVLHLRGFSMGGDSGMSAIRFGSQTFGLAAATDESAARIFSNGMNPSGVLTSDQSLKPDQRKQLELIMGRYAGSQNAGKLMILEAGLEFKAMSLNPEDAQMLEQRRFNIEEMCRWFGMPPIIIGHAAQGQTMWGSGVEQILLSWLVLGINPICRRIEARITKSLLTPPERRRFYAEFTREALLQMDSAAKAAFLSSVTQNGLMTRNEGRLKLNLSRSAQPGADLLTAQSNLAPLDRLGVAPVVNPPPEPAPAPKESAK